MILVISKWPCDKIDQVDRERLAWRKGALGEVIVEQTLAELPDNLAVVNDVSHRFGNIDHVVIGPTGIFVLDSKNWKGSLNQTQPAP
ncbi:hypothetical protein BH18VER1_BH18VER1_16580 [soil metagenome]